ncbi:hypothetical protein HS088_TW03G00259 [Tripterygium wilfordii]|uniref:Uncharacterized protein n=1 Tax=Tripterygium wilfordii TaxID=458696 RepID=A0A7J7DU86_TRIWF|nr:uncharacterized protein LOC119995124 [Tripterygium wilfordii]KAF5749932.1 hypothetical protein HS088_TW03G00259 [Tripterygium wilfordii]
MSDIAMLVAEEYERRIKNSRKASGAAAAEGGGGELEIRFGTSWVSNFGQKMKKLSEQINKMEPKTQIGVAATDGFFSA